ncbi:MAG: helix-turn-helix transcriptional regulator [Pyrinomonadaceae bacterium]
MTDEMAYINELGVSLRKSREVAGLTKDELAAKMGTTKSVISRIEDSTGTVSAKLVRKFAQALGKKVNLEIV